MRERRSGYPLTAWHVVTANRVAPVGTTDHKDAVSARRRRSCIQQNAANINAFAARAPAP